eukprot:g1560.t1
MMNHDINQMKEEITQKDHSLVKEHFDHHKVEKQKVKIRTDLSKVRKQIESSDQIISNQKDEVQKLGRIIQEAEEERQRQRKELGSVVGERDILTTQLVRRGEELSTVYEKIKIQRASLKQGERSFEKTMQRQDNLKQELRQLMENLLALQTDSSDVPERKLDIIRLEQDLLNERAKCQALRDEMKKPINVHRWRKLQDSDPEHYEKLQKLQLLQKEIIKKTESVVEKDLFIQEKERLYVELKNILARQPGPEVAEQLQVYSKNLKEKKHQMKAMKEELEMYKSQVDEYKYSLEKIDDQFVDLQDEYFEVMENHRMLSFSLPYFIFILQLQNPLNYDKWNKIDVDIELVEKEDQEDTITKTIVEKKEPENSNIRAKKVVKNNKTNMSTSLITFGDKNSVFDGTNFDPNKSLYNGDKKLMEKIMLLDESTFCRFLDVQLSQLEIVKDSNYIGPSFAPPQSKREGNNGKKKSNILLNDINAEKKNPNKKAIKNVQEVKDLAPLLNTCLSLHLGRAEAQKVMRYFSGLEAQYLNSLSLDDIEEISKMA